MKDISLFRSTLLGLAALFLLAPPAPAASDTSQTTTSTTQSKRADAGAAQNEITGTISKADFLRKLSVINQSEIKTAKMAQDKAQTPAVKQFAKTLVRNHQTNEDRVKELAKADKIDLDPAKGGQPIVALKNQLHENYTELQKSPKARFDRDFAQSEVEEHEATIQLLKNAQAAFQKENDRPFASLAETTLPMIQKHKEMAQNLLSGGTLGE